MYAEWPYILKFVDDLSDLNLNLTACDVQNAFSVPLMTALYTPARYCNYFFADTDPLSHADEVVQLCMYVMPSLPSC